MSTKTEGIMESHQRYLIASHTTWSKSSSYFKNWRAALLATALFTASPWAFEPVNEYKSNYDDESSYGPASRGGGGSSFYTPSFAHTLDSHTALQKDGLEQHPYAQYSSFLRFVPAHYFYFKLPCTFGDGTMWLSLSKEGKNHLKGIEPLINEKAEKFRVVSSIGFLLEGDLSRTEEGIEAFLSLVQKTLPPEGAPLEDFTRAVKCKSPKTLLTHIAQNPIRWSWLTSLDLSDANLESVLEAGTKGGTAEMPSPLTGLALLPNLREINLSHNRLTAKSLTAFLNKIRFKSETVFSLNLSHNNLGLAASTVLYDCLKETTTCISLNLRNTGLNDSTMDQLYSALEDRLTRMEEIERLNIDFSANPISGATFNKWKKAIEEEHFCCVYSTSIAVDEAAYMADRSLLQNWRSSVSIEGGKITIRDMEGLTHLLFQEIAQELMKTPLITELAIINTPLPSFNLNTASIDDPQLISRLAPLLPLFASGTIKKLTFENIGLTGPDLNALSVALTISEDWANTLTILSIPRNNAGSAIVKYLGKVIQKAPFLKELNVGQNALAQGTSSLATYISGLRKLEKLDISQNEATDAEHAKLLKLLCQDKLLSLRQVTLGNNHVWHLPELGTFIGREHNITLDGKLLNMPGFNWATHGTYVLAHLKEIETLTIKNLLDNFVPAVLSLFENGPAATLQTFDFRTNQWAHEQLLLVLSKIPQSVTRVIIEASSSFNQADTQNFIKTLSNLKNLQRLAIKDLKLNPDPSFEPILALPKFFSLSLHNNGLQSGWASTKSLVFPRGTQLKKLSLSLNQLGPHTRVLINSLPETLEKLSLLHSGADEASLDALHSHIQWNRTLKRLSLYDDQLTDERLKSIKKDMPPKCHFMQVWDTNDLRSDRVKFIALVPQIQKGELKIGPELKKVTQLDFNRLNISAPEAKALAGVFPSCPSLHTIYFHVNQIDDEGAKAIAEALPSCSSLIYLHLHSNQISIGGAEAIAKALPSCPSLQFLDLHSNKIRDEGAKAIAGAAQSHPSLRVLYLHNNPIGAEGKAALDAVKPIRLGVIWHY